MSRPQHPPLGVVGPTGATLVLQRHLFCIDPNSKPQNTLPGPVLASVMMIFIHNKKLNKELDVSNNAAQKYTEHSNTLTRTTIRS